MTTVAPAGSANTNNNGLTEARSMFTEAMGTLKDGGFTRPKNLITAFLTFCSSFWLTSWWAHRNIKEIDVEVVSDIVGSVVMSVVTATLLAVTAVVYITYGCIKGLLEVKLWKLFKSTVKLGCIVLLCLLLYNWRDSSEPFIGDDGRIASRVEQGIGSVCKSGIISAGQSLYNCSDAGKKALLFHEIEELLAWEETVSKTLGGQKIGWVYQDIPSPQLLQAQVRQGRVSFEEFREGLEEASYRIALLLELSRKTPEDCRERFDLCLYQCGDTKSGDESCLSAIREARDHSNELHDRIDILVADMEANSLLHRLGILW